MTTSKTAILSLMLLLAGCAAIDRPAMTKFRPTTGPSGEKAFEYYAATHAVYPPDAPDAEEERMRWLQTWLKENEYCPTGYKIVSRQVVNKGGLRGGVLKDIYYTGVCL